MASSSPENATRWGTSVQLTKRGVNAAAKYWNMGNLERVLTPHDRIEIAHKKVGDILIQFFHFD
jgi:hypothetical protein